MRLQDVADIAAEPACERKLCIEGPLVADSGRRKHATGVQFHPGPLGLVKTYDQCAGNLPVHPTQS